MLNERSEDKLILTIMRKVVLKWDRLSVPLKIKKMRFVIHKMTENAAMFPNPNPDMLILTGLANALDDAETAASQGGTDRTRARDTALEAAINAMNLQVLYVQTITLGDKDMTALAGMETQAIPQPWPEPDRPEGFKVRPGTLEGSVHMFCKGTKYKKEYVFEIWVEPQLIPIIRDADSGANAADSDLTTSGSWQIIHTQSSGRYQHAGLERGRIYRFRVYAQNAKGRSIASSEASCAAR